MKEVKRNLSTISENDADDHYMECGNPLLSDTDDKLPDRDTWDFPGHVPMASELKIEDYKSGRIEPVSNILSEIIANVTLTDMISSVVLNDFYNNVFDRKE